MGKNMSEKWTKETGLVFAIFFLVLGYFGNSVFIIVSGLILVAVLFAPRVLFPLAYIWFHLARVLALIVPKVLFALVFFLIVTPIAFIRRLMKIDTLFLRSMPKSSFVDRNKLFRAEDLEKPY